MTTINIGNTTQEICIITITINDTLTSPVFVYYQIENFYIDYKDYVKSRDWDQIRGFGPSSSIDTRCDKMLYNNYFFNNISSNPPLSFTGNKLDPNAYLNPCGLIATNFFNDSYILSNQTGNITINETGIASSSDKTYMFKRSENYSNEQWLDVENEHFMIWMHMETFNDFKKLWGRINLDIIPGNYTLYINDNYNIAEFEGKKYFVLVTSGTFGSASFFGYALVTASIFCFITIGILVYIHYQKYNAKFDEDKLVWY